MDDLRKRLFHLLVISPDDPHPRGKFLACAISALIVLNLAAAILETVPAYADRWGMGFARFEFLSVMIFSVEYIALLGVGLIAMPAAIIAAGFIEQVRDRHNPRTGTCPTCGRPFETQ